MASISVVVPPVRSLTRSSAVATRVDAACCTDATCAEGTPTACSPTCGLAMAKLKLGPCAERFRSLTDTANGAPANGVSEAMDVLWDTCKALPTPEVRAAVAAHDDRGLRQGDAQ